MKGSLLGQLKHSVTTGGCWLTPRAEREKTDGDLLSLLPLSSHFVPRLQQSIKEESTYPSFLSTGHHRFNNTMTSPSARSASPPSHSFLSPITATSPLSSPPSTLPSPSSVELSPPTSPSSYNPSDPSRSPSRTRSLSPRPSGPTTTTMSLPSPTPSSALPSPNVSGPSLSPRPSKIFASRPSPVVPSPSVPGSRPTSPPPSFQQQHEPVSPTRGGATTTTTGEHDFVTNAPVLSTSSSTVDLSHVFERGEFSSFVVPRVRAPKQGTLETGHIPCPLSAHSLLITFQNHSRTKKKPQTSNSDQLIESQHKKQST